MGIDCLQRLQQRQFAAPDLKQDDDVGILPGDLVGNGAPGGLSKAGVERHDPDDALALGGGDCRGGPWRLM
jgi:hypothetical protein